MGAAYVYIMSNASRTVFYTGSTENLVRRINEHKLGEGCYFTKKYRCQVLLYYATYESVEEAYQLEHKIKRWKRPWKMDLIQSINPNWNDLTASVTRKYGLY